MIVLGKERSVLDAMVNVAIAGAVVTCLVGWATVLGCDTLGALALASAIAVGVGVEA